MSKTADGSAVLDNRDDEKTVGSNEAATSDSEGGIVSGINEKSLLRKLDMHLLPAVGILYLLSFLDRSNGSSPGDAVLAHGN
jgi:MFS transporter, ACS family, DAL5 transporter family protein